MRLPQRFIASLVGVLAAGLPHALAQQYVDERVPVLSDSSTASGTKLFHGDIDGDGWSELVVREFGDLDAILRGGPFAFAFADLADGSDSNGAYGAKIVDLNGDGRGDLLTQDFVNLGYYRGQAGATIGSFVNIQSKGMNEVYWGKDAADVNGDGNIDVIAGLSTDSFGQAGVLRWFSGNGVGNYTFAQSVPSAPYPLYFVVGDFNADGVVDAAATGPTAPEAFVFYGTGTGFALPQVLTAPGAAAHLPARGDFDADGIDDLAGFASSTSISWFRGGAGGLTLGAVIPVPGFGIGARDLVSADLEGDGDDDLLFTGGFSGAGSAWRSFGSPGIGLTAPTQILDFPCDSIAALECDGNPGLDLAYTGLSMTWPTLRPGDGAGGFLSPIDLLANGACTDTDSACAGDLDSDGVLDLAFESDAWLRGIGDGTFHPAAPLGARPSELVDLNGDGRLDSIGLLTTCGSQNGIQVALKQGAAFQASFKPPQAATGTLVAFALADLDLDGDMDLASAGSSGVFTHRNNGNGTFAAFTTTAIPGPSANLTTGDLNGDGFADLARTNYVLDPFQHTVTEAWLHWGLSTGTGLVTNVQSKAIWNSITGQIRIDDLNDDTFADVVWTTHSFAQLNAGFGNGTGNLTFPNPIATLPGSGTLLSLEFADIDGDGSRDLIGGGGANGHVSITKRNGNNYQLWRQIASGAGAGKLLPYDFDADGQIDLAWANGGTTRFALNLKADPAGTSVFGTGTPGCRGRATLSSVQPAKVGNGAFRLLANHLPPSSTGWFVISTGSSLGGSDPFAVGALFHVALQSPHSFVLVPTVANSSGQANLALAIPANPLLGGQSFTTQVVHGGTVGHDCSISPLSLVTSRGLTLTIVP